MQSGWSLCAASCSVRWLPQPQCIAGLRFWNIPVAHLFPANAQRATERIVTASRPQTAPASVENSVESQLADKDSESAPSDRPREAVVPPPLSDARPNRSTPATQRSGQISSADLLILAGTYAMGMWALGSMLLLARLATGLAQVRGLRKRVLPLEPPLRASVEGAVRSALNLERLPPIVVSDRVSQPVAAGLIRPLVILPTALPKRLEDRSLAQVLTHECAHIVRHDQCVGLLQRIAAIAFWPNPLVHLLNRALARAREEVCDNFVIRGNDPSGYAPNVCSTWLNRNGCYRRERQWPVFTIRGGDWSIASWA